MMEESDHCPGGRRELRKRDRRQAIVDAAKDAFLEGGYAAMSMSGLLKTLGGSKATLWSYFRSKEELFGAVIEDVSTAFRAELRETLSLTGELEPTLIGFCRSFMGKISNPDAVATWRLVVAESGRFPEVGRIFYDHAPRHTRAALTAFFTHHIAAGHLPQEDPDKMAEFLTSLCASQHSRLLWGIASPDPAAIEADAAEIVRFFLRGYGVEAGGPAPRDHKPNG